MRSYRVEKTFIPSMGSIDSFIVDETYLQTKEDYALWYLNTMRKHDGLTPWTDIPVKLTYTRMNEKR